MIRVMLVDDHQSMLDGLSFILGQEPDFDIVSQAGSLTDARAKIQPVDVALIDMGLPDGPGTNLIPDLNRVHPGVHILILVDSLDRNICATAVESGADGYVHKGNSTSEIVQVIRLVASGEMIHSQQELMELIRIAARRREDQRRTEEIARRLTPREHEILRVLVRGLNERDIARQLHISENTVRNHVVHIREKLNAHSRLHAVILALQLGIVGFDSTDIPSHR